MRSRWNMNSMMTGRVARVIAVFFLLYTGADLTVRQFCSDEFCVPRIVEASASADSRSSYTARLAVAAANTSDSRGNQPSEPPSLDEDCFCCCTHVLPGSALAVIAISEWEPALTELRNISLPSPPLRRTFHPPRFA